MMPDCFNQSQFRICSLPPEHLVPPHRLWAPDFASQPPTSKDWRRSVLHRPHFFLTKNTKIMSPTHSRGLFHPWKVFPPSLVETPIDRVRKPPCAVWCETNHASTWLLTCTEFSKFAPRGVCYVVPEWLSFLPLGVLQSNTPHTISLYSRFRPMGLSVTRKKRALWCFTFGFRAAIFLAIPQNVWDFQCARCRSFEIIA